MRIPFTSFTIIFCFFINASFAQMKRANQFYENYDYPKAIQLYKKVIKKKESAEALEKIANSYRLIKDYQHAEMYYALLMKQPNVEPINHFFYGMVLKNTSKIDEAKEQFKLYSSAVPDDKKAEICVNSCDDIKIWISKTQQFDVSPVANLNTPHSEFGPVIFNNELVFVSDRSQDLVNNSNYSWNKRPFLNVYSSKIISQENGNIEFSKKAKTFSSQINSNYHDGPVSFTHDQNTIYITHVGYEVKKKDKSFVNRAKLYSSTLVGKKWDKLKSFQYNSDAYSIAHPSISADGQMLYFASDMPGGQGGMDIFVCKKEGDGWGQPQNMGRDVNTVGEEVFPHIRRDGVLYFSSDGHGGFGGLDIYSATKIDDKYSDVKNLGSPLNSSTDDFGIVFSEDFTRGYFSSDRLNGKGSDDIYSFVALNKFLTVSGKILFSQNLNDPAMNAKIMLITEDGKVISVSSTDSTGFFKFEKLDPDTKYMVKLDENDPEIASKKKYYMADDRGKIIRITVINDKGGKFVFMNLPADPNSLPDLGPEMDITIAGNLLYGENPAKPLVNTKVNLVNEKGEIVQTTFTNANGSFVFSDLPPDQNFLVKVDDGNTGFLTKTRITITDKDGKVMQSTFSDKKGGFNFTLLATDSNTLVEMTAVNDVAIAGKIMFGDNLSNPLANKKVNLVNEKGEIIQTVTTDATGKFEFKNLPHDNNYLVRVDEGDTELSPNTKIAITDKKGNEIQSTTSGKNGSFNFALLSGDSKTLAQINENTDVAISGNLMFGDNLANPLANKKVNLVNEKGEIIQTVTTDATGKFVFANLPADNHYLVRVDEGDTQLAPNTKIGITDKTGKIVSSTLSEKNGTFKFSLLAGDSKTLIQMNAAPDVALSGNLMFGDNLANPLANKKVNLLNEKGEIIQSVITDASGKFEFTNLPADNHYLVKVDEGDTELSPNTKIGITDNNGKAIQSTTSGKNGAFNFSLLSGDSKSLVHMNPAPDVAISGNLMFGENPSKPLANKKVNLVNEKGEIIKTVLTDSTGKFNFTGLSGDVSYLVKVDEGDTDLLPNTKITITNKKGKEVLATTTGTQGDFNFSFLASDRNSLKKMSVQTADLRFDLNGKIIADNKSPLKNSVINLINEKGEIVQTTKTDPYGNFKFTNLAADKDHLFAMDENDNKVKIHEKLYLTNEKGVIIKEFKRYNNKYKFAVLKSDQKSLGVVYVEDTQLKEMLVKNNVNQSSSTTVVKYPIGQNSTEYNGISIENIYFGLGETKIVPEAKISLNKLIDIMKNDTQLRLIVSSHTDTRSSAGFNMKLSQRRTEAVIFYLTSMGIKKSRIKGKRFGKTKLVNNCTDDVECKEEEHAKNRRSEFRLVKKGN